MPSTRPPYPPEFMADAHALRGLLDQEARQVIRDIEAVPSLAGVRLFLERFLKGKKVLR